MRGRKIPFLLCQHQLNEVDLAPYLRRLLEARRIAENFLDLWAHAFSRVHRV